MEGIKKNNYVICIMGRRPELLNAFIVLSQGVKNFGGHIFSVGFHENSLLIMTPRYIFYNHIEN